MTEGEPSDRGCEPSEQGGEQTESVEQGEGTLSESEETKPKLDGTMSVSDIFPPITYMGTRLFRSAEPVFKRLKAVIAELNDEARKTEVEACDAEIHATRARRCAAISKARELKGKTCEAEVIVRENEACEAEAKAREAKTRHAVAVEACNAAAKIFGNCLEEAPSDDPGTTKVVFLDNWDSFTTPIAMSGSLRAAALVTEIEEINFQLIMTTYFLNEMRDVVVNFQGGLDLYNEMTDGDGQICPTGFLFNVWLKKCKSREERLKVYEHLEVAPIAMDSVFFNEWLKASEGLDETHHVLSLMAKNRVSTDGGTFGSIIASRSVKIGPECGQLLDFLDGLVGTSDSDSSVWCLSLYNVLYQIVNEDE